MQFNEQQLEALNWDEGPLLVTAGPGSGKTRIIVARVARLVHDGVDPRSILATTFTAKAAAEMNTRLQSYDIDTNTMAIQTMHSFCNRLLQRETYKNWRLDEDNKFNIMIKQATGFRGMKWTHVDLSLVENFISLAKNGLVRPDQALEWPMLNEDPFFGDTRYVRAYFEVEELRQQRRLYTFDDMLIDAVELLRDSPSVRARVQDKYKWVIVDEFQDSNLAQVRLVEFVADPDWNLMAVGDVDQAIYEWRGAVPHFMVNFTETFPAMPEPRVVSMGRNYRSAPNIVDHAAQCIANNEHRITKELVANKKAPALIKAKQLMDMDEEANYIADEAKTLHEGDGVPYGSMFILYRVNAQSRAIEEVFSKRKIPHVVLGSSSFYQRKEVQDILSYLRLLVDPKDLEAGERAINRPFRFIAKGIVNDIVQEADGNDDTFEEAADRIARQTGNARIDDFLAVVSEMREFNATKEITDDSKMESKYSVGSLISRLVKRTSFIEYLESNEGSDTAENSREANIGELIRSADRYTEVKDFLDFVNWQIAERKKKKRTKNSITCMTIHRAKGLEARAVFMIGVNENILPHVKAPEPKEEERRLYYVGMTRAMDFLFITAVEQLGMERRMILDPSRFIFESGIELEMFSPDGDLFANAEDKINESMRVGKHFGEAVAESERSAIDMTPDNEQAIIDSLAQPNCDELPDVDIYEDPTFDDIEDDIDF